MKTFNFNIELIRTDRPT